MSERRLLRTCRTNHRARPDFTSAEDLDLAEKRKKEFGRGKSAK